MSKKQKGAAKCKMCGENISFHPDSHYLCYKCWRMTHDSNPYRSLYGEHRKYLKNKSTKRR